MWQHRLGCDSYCEKEEVVVAHSCQAPTQEERGGRTEVDLRAKKDISTPSSHIGKMIVKWLWCERAKVHTFVMVPGQFGCLRFEMANPRKLDVPHQNLPLSCVMSMGMLVC